MRTGLSLFAMALGISIFIESPGTAFEFFVSPSVDNGDIDGSGSIDVTDAIILIEHLFLGGDRPVTAECNLPEEYFNPASYAGVLVASPANGDVNGDGLLDISDYVYLLTYQFLGGDPPVESECVAAPTSS